MRTQGASASGEAGEKGGVEGQRAEGKVEGVAGGVQSEGRLLEVRAPGDGWVLASSLRDGASLKAGEPLFALAVRDSFRVTGFFRETHLPRIREGARARVTFMAWPGREFEGVVESVGRGIARSDGALGPGLLPRVSPTFDWIRLAQRFPVRVRLDGGLPEELMRVGLTASVQVLEIAGDQQ